MTVNLINQSSQPMPRAFAEKWLKMTLQALKKELKKSSPKVELSIVFLDPAPAKKLNRDYRNKNYATDVLSFQGEWPKTSHLGDLVLCPQVLKKQANDHGHSFKAELGYLLIHGVLHLLGHDHETSKTAAAKMFKIQDQLFDRLCAKFQI